MAGVVGCGRAANGLLLATVSGMAPYAWLFDLLWRQHFTCGRTLACHRPSNAICSPLSILSACRRGNKLRLWAQCDGRRAGTTERLSAPSLLVCWRFFCLAFLLKRRGQNASRTEGLCAEGRVLAATPGLWDACTATVARAANARAAAGVRWLRTATVRRHRAAGPGGACRDVPSWRNGAGAAGATSL